MISAPDFGSRGPCSSPGRVIVLCSSARHFLIMPLSNQEYKWVLGGEMSENPDEILWVTRDGLASHPGGVAILLLRKLG